MDKLQKVGCKSGKKKWERGLTSHYFKKTARMESLLRRFSGLWYRVTNLLVITGIPHVVQFARDTILVRLNL